MRTTPTRRSVGCLVLSALVAAALPADRARACTAFCVYRGGRALFANNEDYWRTDTKLWFVPKEGGARGEAGRYGRVYFGFGDFYPQGGMNEAGLCFDGFATSALPQRNNRGRARYRGNLTDHVMAKCETVDQVVAVFSRFDLSMLTNAMLMFADRNGDSVIIEGDEFLRIDGDHQVVTNFYQSQTPPGKISCRRYQTASRLLASGEPLTVEGCRDVLAATHQEGAVHSQYSNVCDMQRRVVHLWHFHDYEHEVVLDLAEELEKGAHELDLPSLFPEKEAFTRFEEQRRQDALRQTRVRRNEDVDPAGFPDFAGRYEFDVGRAEPSRTELLVEDGALRVRGADGSTAELVPEAEDRFFHIGDNGLQTWAFGRDEEGRVCSVTVTILGNPYRGRRVDPGG